MLLQEEKRKSERLNTFWLAYNDQTNEFLGYIVELSTNGIKVWLKKGNLDQNDFIVKISPPAEINIEMMRFGAQKIWLQKDATRNITEMGCEFINLQEEQKSDINKLLTFFHKDNDKFFNDIELALSE